MKDTVIKGTGNSRWLKSAIEESTTWEQFRDLLRAGTLPIDLAGINMDGIDVLGNMLNKATLLQDFTAQLLGLDPADNPTVDDAFLNTFLTARGAGLLKIQVYETGTETPMSGVKIDGATDLLGDELYADENGLAIGLAVAETSTVTVNADYLDLTGQTTFSGATPAQKVTEITLYATRVSNPSGKVETFTTSTQKRFTDAVKRVDVHCVGGGAGGSRGYRTKNTNGTTYRYYGGYGGGQGKSVYANSVAFSPNALFSITIGAAGTGAASLNPGSEFGTSLREYGTSGGKTSCLTVTAPGGMYNGTTYASFTDNEGSYTRVAAKDGESSTTHQFNDSSLPVAGGGSGGGGGVYFDRNEQLEGGAGGDPNGGNGGSSSSSGARATGYGGGGGGGGNNASSTLGGGGDGYQGVAYIRWWY